MHRASLRREQLRLLPSAGRVRGSRHVQLPSRVARGGVLFLTFLGVVLELPLLLYALVTGSVPRQAAV